MRQRPSPPSRLERSLGPLAAALSFLAFLPALRAGFVWDDEALLVGNFNFRGLGFDRLAWMFSAPRFGQYHPLTWVSFGADYLLYGMSPRGYHATNLFLHAANAVLLYFLVRTLLEKSFDRDFPRRERALAWGAGFAALFFALHPLRVETVAWVTERRGLLSAFFLLLTLLCWLKERQVPALCFYLLSLLSKATGVVLPAVLVLLDLYPLRRSGKRVWIEKIPYAVLALPFALAAPAAQSKEGAMQSWSTYGLLPRVGQAAYGSVLYLWKTLVPWNLSAFIRFPDQVDPFLNGWIFSSLIVFTAITAAAFLLYKKRPLGLAAWGCYLALLAPVLGFFQSGPHFAAYRYTYLPGMALAALAGAAFASFLRERRFLPFAFGAALLAGLAALSWRQTLVWRSSESLWTNVVSLDPDAALARNNLCTALRDAGRRAEALEQCKAALRLRPEYEQARCNYGSLLLDEGATQEALAQFQEAVRLEPADPIAANGLGYALLRAGRVEEAVGRFEAALKIKPDFPLALDNLGAALQARGRGAEAVGRFERALALDPDDLRAHSNLAAVLAEQGKLSEAAVHYREAIRLKPDFAEAYNNLGIALFRQGRAQAAVESFERALRIKPGYEDARFNLARARQLLEKRR